MKSLTFKQANLLDYLIDFQEEKGRPPTIRELMEPLNVTSLRGVTVHLDALHRKGFLTRDPSARSIKVLRNRHGELMSERTCPHCGGKL